MDEIMAVAFSIQDPLVRGASLLMDNALIYVLIVLFLVYAGEGRTGKRTKIIVSMMIAVALAWGFKSALAVERPCAGEPWCPHDGSFPSLHAAAAFALMTAFLDKKAFPAYLLFAFFVCFTRLNLGVHTFRDIAGALPVALLAYYITDMAWPVVESRLWLVDKKKYGGYAKSTGLGDMGARDANISSAGVGGKDVGVRGARDG